MSMHEDATPSGDSLLSKMEEYVDRNWDPFDKNPDSLVLDFLRCTKALLHEEQAIKLRVARLLAWARGRDVGEGGRPNWTAFMKQHSPWGPSRSYDYLRLASSNLTLEMDAVAKNEIDITMATRAPKLIGADATEEAQRKWLAEATCQQVPYWHRACQDVFTGDELLRIVKARELAAIFIGWAAPPAVLDAFMLDCLEQQLTGEQIIERARAAPAKPDRLGKKPHDWTADPADSLLGPWVEPKDIEECVEMLNGLNTLLDWREVLLGQAYFLIKFHALWTSVDGCNSLRELCITYLQIGQTTLQRYARQGLQAFQYPDVRAEIQAGRLPLDKATYAIEHASGDRGLPGWLELVRRLGRVELAHADETRSQPLMDYQPALKMARDVESIVSKAKEGGMGAAAETASRIGGSAARIAEHLLAVGGTGEIEVAVRDDANRRSPPPPPQLVFGHPSLLRAADYLLQQVQLPPVYGPRRMVAHDCWFCQNPRCRRPTIRLHPHHMEEQQYGGARLDGANILGLCPGCHLRGVHNADWIRVKRIDDWIVFVWRDHSVAIMHSPVEWARKEVAKWMATG